MAIMRFSNQHPSLFDRFFDNDLFDWSSRNYSSTDTTLPSVNIKESGEDFEVEVAAPGFTKKDFRIELNHISLRCHLKKKLKMKRRRDNSFLFGSLATSHLAVHSLCQTLLIVKR